MIVLLVLFLKMLYYNALTAHQHVNLVIKHNVSYAIVSIMVHNVFHALQVHANLHVNHVVYLQLNVQSVKLERFFIKVLAYHNALRVLILRMVLAYRAHQIVLIAMKQIVINVLVTSTFKIKIV